MITELFEDAFKYTFKDKKAFLKLGIISLFSFLIIPLFLLFGYSYRVVFVGLQGVMIESRDPLPPIKPISSLLKQGLKIFLIIFIYSIISVLISLLIFSTTGLFTASGTGISNFSININTGTFYIVLLLILWFISFLFISIAIPNMIENKGSLKSAFNIKEIINIIKISGLTGYIKFYLAIILLIILTLIITFFISQGIVNIISLIFIILNNALASSIVGSLSVIIFLILELLVVVPFFVILQSRFISFIYDPGE